MFMIANTVVSAGSATCPAGFPSPRRLGLCLPSPATHPAGRQWQKLAPGDWQRLRGRGHVAIQMFDKIRDKTDAELVTIPRKVERPDLENQGKSMVGVKRCTLFLRSRCASAYDDRSRLRLLQYSVMRLTISMRSAGSPAYLRCCVDQADRQRRRQGSTLPAEECSQPARLQACGSCLAREFRY